MTGEKNLDKSQIAEDRTGRDVNPIIVLQETLAGVALIADDREAARMAIIGVIVFMKSLPGFTLQIRSPLMNLGLALVDLEDGKVSPMLKPAKKSKGGRTPDLFTRDALKACAAAMTEVLMKRAGMPRLDAAGEVAKVLRENRIPIGKRDSTEASQKNAVAQWRFDAGADPKSLAGTLYHELSNPPLPPGLTSDEVKNLVLQSLDEILKESRLKGSPPTDF